MVRKVLGLRDAHSRFGGSVSVYPTVDGVLV